MKAGVGRIVKLLDYSRVEHQNEYAEIEKVGSDFVKVRWILDGIRSEILKSNIEVLNWHSVKSKFAYLQVGDWVICNGSEKEIAGWVYGKIGEKTANMVYIWNNQRDGSHGRIVPRGLRYSWVVNKECEGKIMIVKKNDALICSYCQHSFAEDKLLECCDGEIYCDTCREELFGHCEKCGEQHSKNNLTYSDITEKMYCNNCWAETFSACSCGTIVANDDSREAEGCYWCDNCFNDRFSTCAECDEVYRRDDLHEDEESGDWLCIECMGVDTNNLIKDYSYCPKWKKYHEAGDEKLYMGVELEVQREKNYMIYAQKFINFIKSEGKDKYFYLKKDSSLHNSGFEIVTQPFTLKYAHKNIEFYKILKWLKENKLNYGEETHNCGLHIHLSKDFFEESDITRLRLFFLQNKKNLFKLSGRQEENNSYCAYEDISAEQIAKSQCGSTGHHNAISTKTSKGTIEIRIFNSTLDSERFISALQFADAISHYVKVAGTVSFFLGNKNRSWNEFIRWAREENKYQVMLKFLKKKKLIDKKEEVCA